MGAVFASGGRCFILPPHSGSFYTSAPVIVGNLCCRSSPPVFLPVKGREKERSVPLLMTLLLLATLEDQSQLNTKIPRWVSCCFFFIHLSETKGLDHGDGFYAGRPIPCADSYASFCVHGKCEIKYNMVTCRSVSAFLMVTCVWY